MGVDYSHMWNRQRIKTKVAYKETLLPFLHHLNPPWSWYYLYSGDKKAKVRGTGNFPCCTALRWLDPCFSLTYRCHIQATPCDQCFLPSVMFESLKTICGPVLGDARLPCWLFPTPFNADELPGSSPDISHISTASGSQGLASLGWLSVGFFPNKIELHQTKRWRAMWASGPHRLRLSTGMWLHNTEGRTQKTQSSSCIDVPDCLPMSSWTRLGKQSQG